MEELKKRVSLIDFKQSYSADDHQDIYNLIDAIPTKDASSMRPPPALVFYAARNIISPSFILGQIPDLLNLLALLETLRRYAVLKSDEVLEWQIYYKRAQSNDQEHDVRLLAASEVSALRGYLTKKDAQRREYVVLVKSLIQLYIHYLWTAPESCLMWKRFNDFFPGSIEGIDEPSRLLFHIGLSENEKAYFERLKVECREWLKIVADWDRQREETLRDEGASEVEMAASFKDDFYDAFPPPFEPSEMSRNVEIYINKVESMVRTLGEWFGSSCRNRGADGVTV